MLYWNQAQKHCGTNHNGHVALASGVAVKTLFNESLGGVASLNTKSKFSLKWRGGYANLHQGTFDLARSCI
jgi:hypothetical protein